MLVPVLLFIVGLVLLIKGGDWFVDGACDRNQRSDQRTWRDCGAILRKNYENPLTFGEKRNKLVERA